MALKKVSTSDWDRKSIDLVLEVLKQNIRAALLNCLSLRRKEISNKKYVYL